jgi:hypothetical protein
MLYERSSAKDGKQIPETEKHAFLIRCIPP